MKPILLNNSLLCAVMDTLAERIVAFVNARHLATIMPDHPVSDWHYRDWRDLQATLRSLPAEWRKEALYNLRRALRTASPPMRSRTGGFQGWLARVRDCDAASGKITAYTPHQPGLFLKPLIPTTAEPQMGDALPEASATTAATLQAARLQTQRLVNRLDDHFQRAGKTLLERIETSQKAAAASATAQGAGLVPASLPGTHASPPPMPTANADKAATLTESSESAVPASSLSPSNASPAQGHQDQPSPLACPSTGTACGQASGSKSEMPPRALLPSSTQPSSPDPHAATGF
jgi:hypothetical protein